MPSLMPRPSFGAQPSVLRCSRCGRFVDWAESRLQVVCGCRAALALPPVLVRESGESDRPQALELFRRDFGHTRVVAFGETIDLEHLKQLVALMKGEVAGALAYRELPDALHVVALATDPTWQRSGVGGHLVAEAELVARSKNLPRVTIATTNDNLPALYFYQRRHYVITAVIPGGMVGHLADVPHTGFAGIPIRDEIRMERRI